MIKVKNTYLPLVAFFLLAQSIFLIHQLDHFECEEHSEPCVVCVLESSGSLSLSQSVIALPVFKKEVPLKKPPLTFIKENFSSQTLPRSPPLIYS